MDMQRRSSVVKDKDFYFKRSCIIKDLLKQDKVIILFSAPSCGACLPVDSILKNYLRNVSEIIYAKIDLSKKENAPLARRYNIRSLPNVIFFKKGKPVYNLIGLKHKYSYHAKISAFRKNKSLI